MRHYVAVRPSPEISDVQEIIRFNEAIDQALAESITEYDQAVSGYRDMFLAVLGHDLRSPLNAILGASSFLADAADLAGRDHDLAVRIVRAATTMSSLIDDLLEYTSEELGEGITLRRSRTDLREIAADVVREAELSHAGREILLRSTGETVGEWDAGRLRQALSNLVTNAARHAPEDSAVTVTLSGDAPAGEVVATVHNLGDPIPEPEQHLIFQPFRHGSSGEGGLADRHGSIGLGLYIARRMAEAHGGTVQVDSSAEAGTTFSLRLPGRAPEAMGGSDAESPPA
jgi:signal transduction histidine kinase